jgi:hypothetical protein
MWVKVLAPLPCNCPEMLEKLGRMGAFICRTGQNTILSWLLRKTVLAVQVNGKLERNAGDRCR